MTSCWTVYCHTNIINNKKYIGITKCDPIKRFRNGKGYSKRCQPIFWAAIQRYGWNNFSHTILETDINSLQEANLREQYWIKYYNTYIYSENSWGYNATPGGNIQPGHAQSKLAREKISLSLTSSQKSLDTKLKISIAKAGVSPSEEHLNNIRSHHYKIKIKCIETNEIFESIKDAVAKYGPSVYDCLAGKIKTAYKLHWEKL